MFGFISLCLCLAQADASLMNRLVRVFSLSDYNTRIVVLGTAMLGLAAGIVGSFTLLRRRALMGDALSHATLPGIGLAFLFGSWLGVEGKSLPLLLFGAAVTGTLGMLAILLIRQSSRIKEDAAMGIVLSVFFGLGIAVLGTAQKVRGGNQAGLEGFIMGQPASLQFLDVVLICSVCGLAVVCCTLLYKELTLLCFDQGFAKSRGYNVLLLDFALMSLVVLITIVGLQAVGLILMIALLVVPPAAARFWSEKLHTVVILAACIGCVSCTLGAMVSGLAPKLPAGAIIVLTAVACFGLSMVFGIKRGVLVRAMRRWRLNRIIDRDHLLRAVSEILETRSEDNPNTLVKVENLLPLRSWSRRRLNAEIQRATHDSLLIKKSNGQIQLTDAGSQEAARLVREHRLWELYLIHYADIAPSQVDRGADMIEHVLDPEIVTRLERLLSEESRDEHVASPHPLPQEDPATESDPAFVGGQP